MPEYTLEDEGEQLSPRQAAVARAQVSENQVLAGFQREVDEWYATMKTFAGMDPPEVLLNLSSWHARALEMRSNIMRSGSNRANGFRTKELDPFLEGCEFQFRVHSRLLTIRQHEWDLAKGQY